MKTGIYGAMLISVFCVTLGVNAGSNAQLSPGMESVKVGDVNLVVPKGAKVHKEGSLLVVEDMGTYSARKFVEIEGKLKHMEEEQGELKAQIEGLAKTVRDLQKTRLR